MAWSLDGLDWYGEASKLDSDGNRFVLLFHLGVLGEDHSFVRDRGLFK